MFKSISSNPEHKLDTICPLSSVRTDTQRILSAVKSPIRIRGGGNWEIRLIRSASATGIAGGKYTFDNVNEMMV
jgi:hypothetical protein